jgi:hypothetical protein
MTCSGVGGVGQNPYQFLQTSSAQKATNDANATDDTTAPDAAATAQLQQQLQLQTQGQSGAHHHHHGGGGKRGGAGEADAVSDLLSTIQQALQSADSSDDPNKVIQDTVTKLLSGGAPTDGSDGSKSSGTATTTAATATDAKQSFADVLKAHGVDFQQFRADLMAAVKNAQNGQVNAGTALKSFAPGSSVDLTA